MNVYKYAKQAALGLALGIKGVLRKRRTLYMIGQTRVHLDQVEGLGDFMELEVHTWLVLFTKGFLTYCFSTAWTDNIMNEQLIARIKKGKGKGAYSC